MMNIIFLGTSGMRPTKERNHSCIILEHNKENIMFDCGEGTQRQMKIAGIDFNRISTILISHWHGDHVLGIPGFIQSLAAQNYSGTLHIYGPKGTKKRINAMFKAFVFDNPLKIEIKEIKKDGIFLEKDEYTIAAYKLEHSTPCIGFVFKEADKRKIKTDFIAKLGIPHGPLLGKLQEGKDILFNGKKIKAEDATTLIEGKKIGYIADTAVCEGCAKIAKNADLLISESTHASNLEDKAEEYQHLTAKQAGLIALHNNAKKLILTHFSQRYKNTKELEEDAKTHFDNVICAYDFMKIKL